MTIFGLDYVSGPSVPAMKAAGVAFVCRYVGYFSGYDPTTNPGKVLTPAEAKSLHDAGIALVSNYEWYAARPLEGHDAGVWDAGEAEKIHLACGGPASAPIYFSVDTDVEGAQVEAYFLGVAQVLGIHRTGAYGSFRVLSYLFDNGLITYGWQTYAWSGGQWESRAAIQQYQNTVTMDGHEVDYDRALVSDYGQWGAAVPGGQWDAIDLHIWESVMSVSHDTGIARAWLEARHAGKEFGPPLRAEYGDSAHAYQEFARARCVWTHASHSAEWLDGRGKV